MLYKLSNSTFCFRMGNRTSSQTTAILEMAEDAIWEDDVATLERYHCQAEGRVSELDLNALLHLAAKVGRVKCLDFLLQCGADPCNAMSKDKNTPLHKLCSTSHPDCCKMLLQAKADINAQNVWLRTPLITAIINFRFRLASQLIRENADVNIADENGTTPLMVCSSYGDRDLLRELIANNANINMRDQRGRTALHFAVVGTHMHIIQDLINLNCMLSTYDIYGHSPLHVAITKCNTHIVNLLISSGIVVEPTEAHILDLCVKIVQSTVTRCIVHHLDQDCMQAMASLECLRQVTVAMGRPLKKSIREKLNRLEKSLPLTESLTENVQSVLQQLQRVQRVVAETTANAPVAMATLQNLCRKVCREALMASGHNVVWAAKRLDIHSFLVNCITFQD